MTVSYSGISMYNSCPSSFQRKYLLKEAVKNPPTKETAPAMFRGIDLHGEIELLLNDQLNKLSKEIEKYTEFCIGLRTMGAVAELPFAFDSAWQSVEFDDEVAEVRGFLDCTLVTDNDYVVYEWKTGKKYDSHVLQRNLYGLAGLLLHPDKQEVRVITVYLDHGHNEETTYHRDMLSTYKWMWERHINKTKPPQPYPMRPSWKCKSCGFSRGNGGKCPN